MRKFDAGKIYKYMYYRRYNDAEQWQSVCEISTRGFVLDGTFPQASDNWRYHGNWFWD